MKHCTPSVHAVPQRVIARVWDHVDVGGWWDCWPWLLSSGSHGYGQIGWQTEGRNAGTTAHRVAWMSIHGSIPEGFTIDHECRNRRCCNPIHLRLLSNVDNATDNGQADKMHCPAGHEYAGANLYVCPKGSRRCRQCARDRRKRT